MDEMNEKEYEGMLLDQLTLVERIKKATPNIPETRKLLETLEEEAGYIKRKLLRPSMESL